VTVPLVVNLPKIVPVVGFFTDDQGAAAITEFYPNGALENEVNLWGDGNPPAGFGATELSKCIFGIAFVMAQFHSR
jgi:hypothetical protein